MFRVQNRIEGGSSRPKTPGDPRKTLVFVWDITQKKGGPFLSRNFFGRIFSGAKKYWRENFRLEKLFEPYGFALKLFLPQKIRHEKFSGQHFRDIFPEIKNPQVRSGRETPCAVTYRIYLLNRTPFSLRAPGTEECTGNMQNTYYGKQVRYTEQVWLPAQHPVYNLPVSADMAPAAMLMKVLLVILLGPVKLLRGNDPGHHGPAAELP